MRPTTVPLPRRCIFCGKEGRLTKEDFFPRWFREIYPAPPDDEKKRLNAQTTWHEVDPDTCKLVVRVEKGLLARPGDLADQTLRAVCAKCNNEWMSGLQNEAKPALLPYIQGKWSRPNRAARKVISSWATMFAMVVEFGDEQSAVVPQIEREVFRRDQRPPIGAYVWAGRLSGDLPYWFHRRTLSLAHQVTGRATHPNAQLTTITLGHLLLQVYLTTSDLVAFDPEQRALEQGLIPLWPLNLTGTGHHTAPVRDKEAARDFAYTHIGRDIIPGIAAAYRRHPSGLLAGGLDKAAAKPRATARNDRKPGP